MLAAAFFLAVAGAAGFFGWKTMQKAAQFQNMRAELAELEARTKRFEAFEARWETVAPRAEALEQAYLSREDVPSFLGLVERTALDAGVSETTRLVEEGEEDLRFGFEAEGRFENLFVFLTHVHVLPVVMFVEEIGLSADTASGAEGAPPPGDGKVDIVVRVPLQQ